MIHQRDFFSWRSAQCVLMWRGQVLLEVKLINAEGLPVVADLLRLPGLVLGVLCIHQIGSFSGQEDEWVSLRAGSAER